jgi:single-strand DNA-binding protein
VSLVNGFDITGNLGRDAEARYTSSGIAVSDLNVAVSEKVKTKDEYVDKTEWFRVTLWRHDNLIPYLKKGTKVRVRGRMENDKYEKDGVTHYAIKFVAEDILLISTKSQSSDEAPPPEKQKSEDPPWGDDQNWSRKRGFSFTRRSPITVTATPSMRWYDDIAKEWVTVEEWRIRDTMNQASMLRNSQEYREANDAHHQQIKEEEQRRAAIAEKARKTRQARLSKAPTDFYGMDDGSIKYDDSGKPLFGQASPYKSGRGRRR